MHNDPRRRRALLFLLTAITLAAQADGDIHVTLADQLPTLLAEPNWENGLLSGAFLGELRLAEPAGSPHRIELALRPAGDALSGFATQRVGVLRPARLRRTAPRHPGRSQETACAGCAGDGIQSALHEASGRRTMAFNSSALLMSRASPPFSC